MAWQGPGCTSTEAAGLARPVCLHADRVSSPALPVSFPVILKGFMNKDEGQTLLPLFSTSAGTHLINFLISLGTNDLRFHKPKLSLFFLLLTTKKYARTTEEEEEEGMPGWQQQKKQIHLREMQNVHRENHLTTVTNVPHSLATHLLSSPNKNQPA